MFSRDELNRYSRQLQMKEIGAEGQSKIKAARVLVIGAGGLGCPALQYLTAAGTGTLGIVDFDTVEMHNLHRQILYTAEDIGKKKAVAAAEKLAIQNPHCHSTGIDACISGENAAAIIAPFDIILDGSDNFDTRYAVNDACVQLGKPLIYGSIFNFEAQLAVFNYRGSKNLRHLYPEPPNPEDVPGCSDNGVLGIVPGITGTIMCHWTLQIILGHTVEVNTLLLADLQHYQFRKLAFG